MGTSGFAAAGNDEDFGCDGDDGIVGDDANEGGSGDGDDDDDDDDDGFRDVG
jgi:hypothetical protein